MSARKTKKTPPLVEAEKPSEELAIATLSQTARTNRISQVSEELTRTHRAFGLFPHALLLLGYGESNPEKEREFTVEEKDLQTGATLTRHMKVYTKSVNGLPRGRDPQVLLSLLSLVFKKQEFSNSVWFRKSDLIKTLGWSDTPENRQDIEQAIERYFDTAYRGLNILKGKTRDREHEQVRRIITGYDRIDERQVRHRAEQQQNGLEKTGETERLFSKVIFDPEFINDVRGGELSLTINLDVVRKLKSSSIAVRLYEVINYLTSPENLTFSIPILELAHERLGISKTLKSPSQCWQKIEKAGAKLLKESYLVQFDYNAKDCLVNGEVSSQRVSPQTIPLQPLPKSEEKRKKILQQFLNLGTYEAATAKLLQQLPDELLDDAEIIAEFIAREKGEKNYAAGFKWGGRAFNQLKFLAENGEINQTLLSRHLLETDEQTTLSLPAADEPESIVIEVEPIAAARAEEPVNTQLALPISFTEIEIVNEEAQILWNNCFNILSKKLSAAIIETWFTEKTVTPIDLSDRVLKLQTNDEAALNWIKKQYGKDLQQAVDEATQTKKQFKILLKF